MPRPASSILLSYCKPLGAVALALVMAGCATQRPDNYYDAPHDSTEADARKQAQGRQGASAPAQIQLGFGGTQAAKANDDSAAAQASENVIKARPLAEPKTFLGTIPCLAATAACSATRLTLTLAPGGEWRSRTVLLDTPDTASNIVQQGCWNVVGTEPLRIVLSMANDASKANLTFINDNVLRINMIDNIRPTLNYSLTRQADVDGIDELAAKAPLSCN
ncbi:copper resistance protein NlpE N-terminal domain-containing protein [Pollutimonas thiosulfatoxidans]|uniref:Copper resistance protein NlpE n=1 Tax=Pollutimonas thiosulfatoxidans TaxID=2028345 RepID=A0A410GG07_9BURK|nr:copper resistance protein NlpE N-terminal domain-containing protein [Pollutimonas thiosulfatoxidans]MBF6616746.1 hypothetical protein [Candidimonas sp.]NYT45157.1 hypothetical protein [Alcaligenaceae bacterium]QAA95224.1 hypothetical protein CKA81_16140 [Pollutimonas thiosulfatoxidans]